jgi:hypothetical protein
MGAATKTTEKPAVDNNNPLTKFDAPVLKAMELRDLTETASGFKTTTIGEAMEVAKLMASSNFVPPHLRGRAGDCLAVVMQATRWSMEPFAVANKTYFVNDRMAYEAQLVIAVINTRAQLKGRLEFSYEGDGNNLICTVSGTLRGDDRPKIVEQEISMITTRNSPLWKQAPRQQLGYYTARLWARLHCPEVLLGVYTVDELQDGGQLEPGQDGTYRPTPARPQRGDYKPSALTAELADEPEVEQQAEPEAEVEEWLLANSWGEVQTFSNETDFAIELGKCFEAVTDRKAVTTLEANNREMIAKLSPELRGGVVDTIDEALKRVDLAAMGKKPGKLV